MIIRNDVQLLFEDQDILVCKKPPSLATQTKQTRSLDLVSILKKHLYMQNPKNGEPYLGIIHRLDQPVSGILVFAKNQQSANSLSTQIKTNSFNKQYASLVLNKPTHNEGTLNHYLIKDVLSNMSHVCNKQVVGSKKATLHYKSIANPSDRDYNLFSHIGSSTELIQYTYLHIQLVTGRHHQIRVQTSASGFPILGDTKYGFTDSLNTWQDIALCAYQLDFFHPKTKKAMSYSLV